MRKSSIIKYIFIASLLLSPALILLSKMVSESKQLAFAIKTQLTGNEEGDTLRQAPVSMILHNEQEVRDYFLADEYPSVWLSNEGALKQHATVFINRIMTAHLDGLDPLDYHWEEIENELKQFNQNNKPPLLQVESIANLEILLTDAFFSYVSHQYAGRIHTREFNTSWLSHISEISPADSLRKIGAGADADLMLNSFCCRHKQFQLLKNKLSECYRLTPVNDDVALVDSVQQVVVNMERWRWLPHSLPERYAMANLANHYLRITEHDTELMLMKIISGTLNTPTPIFYAKASYLVINPWWEIPFRISTREILPNVKADRTYALGNHIQLFRKEQGKLIEVNMDTISWDSLNASNFPYRFRQSPGPWNALGNIKIMFPNPYDIYFHDTPGRELFSKEVRTFSHGCIRIEKPTALAALLLGKDTAWVQREIEKGTGKIWVLPQPCMVYLCYWTLWFDENNMQRNFPDVYDYDAKLSRLMKSLAAESRHFSIQHRGFVLVPYFGT